jgi:type III secretory pathway component EscS
MVAQSDTVRLNKFGCMVALMQGLCQIRRQTIGKVILFVMRKFVLPDGRVA